MPDESSRPYDGLARWLSDEHPLPVDPAAVDPPPRRRQLRTIILTLPWVAMLVVLTTTALTDDATTDDSVTPPVATPGATDLGGATSVTGGAIEPDTAVTGADAAGAREVSGTTGARDHEPPGAVAAVAVGLVRDAVTTSTDSASSAVDLATAGGALALGPEQWLVRVRVVLLRGDTRRWRTATHEIWAVPVGTRSGQVVGLETPWRVARDRPSVASLEWSPTRVDDAMVRAALARADIEPDDDLDAQRHPDLVGIVRVRTAAHGHYVWLRIQPEPQVLGLPAAAATPGSTASEPDSVTPESTKARP